MLTVPVLTIHADIATTAAYASENKKTCSIACAHFEQLIDNSCFTLYVGFFFFFQAEDGIRDSSVTGVQTCALPISTLEGSATSQSREGLPQLRGGLPVHGQTLHIWRVIPSSRCIDLHLLTIAHVDRADRKSVV